MKTIFLRLLFPSLLFIGIAAQAQNTGSVSGRVINSKDKQPIDYATVVVKSLKDSSNVGSVQTSTNGTFIIKGLKNGNYQVRVGFLGLKNATKNFTIVADKANVNVGDIAMEDDVTVDLKTVEIKGAVAPVVVKKDTVQFNASSFKTRENAVVEDALKKMPGVEVAKDGTIKAQGEQITKIKVDGKEFFGNDPLLATKNLPADMVDKYQIIDELSDQAKFSGVDDGNRTKILNITTKRDKKKGYFGNTNVGYGTDDRYDVSLNVNRFNNEQQMSLVGQFNNVNKQNFGGGGFGGGGRGGFGGGRGMQISFGGNGGGSGITTTTAAGFNFSDTYADETQFNASYFYNKGNLFNLQTSLSQTLLGNGENTTFDNRLNSTSDNINHRLNFMIDTKLDSTTTIRIQPNISYTVNDGNSINSYTNLLQNAKTVGSQDYKTHSTAPNINNNLLVRKRFQRRGRTLSFNLNTSINDNDAANYNIKVDNITNNTGDSQVTTNQFIDQGGASLNNTARLVYTEPLSKTLSLEFNYQNGYSRSNSDRYAYDYNPASSAYDIVNTRYTNVFDNTVYTNALGFSFNKTEKKYNWNVGLAVQNTDWKNVNQTLNRTIRRDMYNITPSAQFNYTFSNTKRLRFRYRGATVQPSIAQIQPVQDISNAQTVQNGNPDLKPSFNNSLFVLFNNFDVAKNRSLFAILNINQTYNAFGTSSVPIINDVTRPENNGKLATTPINVDGVYSGLLNIALGIPIIKGNKLNLNPSLRATYGRSVNFTNSRENITNEWSISNGYKFVSTFEKFDFTMGVEGTMSRATYSAQESANTRYYTLNPNVDMGYMLPGNVRVGLALDYLKNTGRGSGFDNEYTLMNSYISRQFFKNKGTFKFSVNDALNQNQGFSATNSNNTITLLTNNVLKRYYMFTFTYSLNNMMGRSQQGSHMGMPGMGGGRGIRMGM